MPHTFYTIHPIQKREHLICSQYCLSFYPFYLISHPSCAFAGYPSCPQHLVLALSWSLLFLGSNQLHRSLLLWSHCSHIYIKWLFTVPGFAIRLLWNTEFYCISAWIQSKIIFSYILISLQNYTLLYLDKCQKCSHSLVALNSTAVRENVVLQGSVNLLASSVLCSVWFCLSSFSSLFLKTTGFLCEPGEQFHTIASPYLHQAVAYIRPVSYLLHQVLRCIKQHITNCESKR